MFPMERTMYQEEIREMSSRLSSLSYELGNCAESLWDIIGHEEDPSVAVVDVGIIRSRDFMQFPVNMTHKYYLKKIYQC